MGLWEDLKVPSIDGDPIVQGLCGLCSVRFVTVALEDSLSVGAGVEVAA